MGMSPHKLIGMVTLDKYIKGTGVLISPNLVLTAAVNAFDTWSTDMHAGLCFAPGFSSATPRELLTIEATYVPSNFFQEEEMEYNYCLLKLSKKVNIKEFLPLKEDA